MGRTHQNYQPPLTLRQLDWLRYNGSTCHFILIEDIDLLISDFLSTVQCLEALLARWSLLSDYTH